MKPSEFNINEVWTALIEKDELFDKSNAILKSLMSDDTKVEIHIGDVLNRIIVNSADIKEAVTLTFQVSKSLPYLGGIDGFVDVVMADDSEIKTKTENPLIEFFTEQEVDTLVNETADEVEKFENINPKSPVIDKVKFLMNTESWKTALVRIYSIISAVSSKIKENEEKQS